MSFFDTRVRGFRVVEIGALSILLVLVVALYLSKTGAGRERSDITTAERQIAEEQSRSRLLEAEVAHLESPERLSALATAHLGLAPVGQGREITVEQLQTAALGGVTTTTPSPSAAPAAAASSSAGAER